MENLKLSLLDAITYGHVERTKDLLSGYPNVNDHIVDELTPLDVAIQYGRASIVKLLLERGADPNQQWTKETFRTSEMARAVGASHVLKTLRYQDAERFIPDKGDLRIVELLYPKESKSFMLPLQLAVMSGNKEIVSCLLNHGADHRCKDGLTPLHVACHDVCTGLAIAEMLLEKGADANSATNGITPLHFAVRQQRSFVELLLKYRANVNAKNSKGETPLHSACRGGDFETVNLLIQRGSDPNVHNHMGNTPLHIACQLSRSTFIVECLLKHGGLVDARNQAGETALHIAVEDMKTEIVKILIENGANVNAQTVHGNTPLHVLLLKNYIVGLANCVKMLLKYGSDPNIPNHDREYPFQLVLKHPHLLIRDYEELIDHLLDHNANINVRDNDGNSLLHIAAPTSGLAAIYLLKKGFRANARNHQGETALHIACKGQVTPLLEELLKRANDINAVTNYGYTPVLVAIKNGNIKITNILFEKGAMIDFDDEKVLQLLDLTVSLKRRVLMKPVVMHVNKMKVAKVSVNKFILQLIHNDDYLRKYSEQSYEECREKFMSEIEFLKVNYAYGKLSYYDVLRMHTDDLAYYSKNKLLKKNINSTAYCFSCPSYCLLLKYRFQKAVKRRALHDACVNKLMSLTKLSYLIIRAVMYNMSDEALRHLAQEINNVTSAEKS